MAIVTKTVDKTSVNGSEIFVYTINVSYNGLTKPAQEGKLVDFFPSKILYQLPKPGGQLVSISEKIVSGGKNVEFNFGKVDAGTSLSFTVACKFGPGRVDNDSFTNSADLYADDTIVATGSAPRVNLKLDENFNLIKSTEVNGNILPGQLVTFNIMLRNDNDPGARINNIVIRDVLPPQLIPDTTFTPIGNDQNISNFEDATYNGRTGSWDGNTLNFTLPSYNGSSYKIVFKARVADNVPLGETIKNVATWTVDGISRKDAIATFKVYKDEAKAYLGKNAPDYAQLGKPIQYNIVTINTGTVPLTNYIVTDTLPPEVDITKLSVFSSDTFVESYNLYVETSQQPGNYETIALNLKGNSGVYDLTPFISKGNRVLSVKAIISSFKARSNSFDMNLYGIVNDTAIENQVVVNEVEMSAKSSVGDVAIKKRASTVLNGKSILNLSKSLLPQRSSYYPLNEFIVKLESRASKANTVNPTFSDLLPIGLDYVPGNDYFTLYDVFERAYYDSRQPGFPIALPTTEVIKNYKNTGRTLVRFKFNDFTLLNRNSLNVYFGVLVTLNPPNQFVNTAYLGNPGDNAQVDGTSFTDTLDLDGDSIVDEQIVESNQVSGTILTTSEFSLEKWVKGNLSMEFSKASTATEGGEIIYKLAVTNNQDMDLKNIEIVDILPYVGDTGVILDKTSRDSQFNVYATSVVNAEIVNILDEPVNSDPIIKIEYSDSNDPVRFDKTGEKTIGSGTWSSTPPLDITTLASVRITTDPSVILKPYERLIVTIKAKAPLGVEQGKLAYNSYAVRADKISGGVTSKMNPSEPNKVSVQIKNTTQGSLGNFVWSDLNGNGLYDDSEPGVNGVLVELYDSNGTKLADTVTANDNNGNPGYYSFTNLATGDYYVKFIPYGDYTLTVQKSSEAKGSKPDPVTGETEQFTLDKNQIMTMVNAGLLLPICEPPVIHAEDKCLHVGDEFNPMSGVSAVDCKGKDITADVTVTFSDVDTAIAGNYSVTYSVTDERGQTTSKTIKVKVCKNGPRQQAISDLFESVALEQTALGHILNAEGEKIQKAVQLNLPMQDMIKINSSVKDMTDAIARLEMVLESKLELFDCNPCGDDCCK